MSVHSTTKDVVIKGDLVSTSQDTHSPTIHSLVQSSTGKLSSLLFLKQVKYNHASGTLPLIFPFSGESFLHFLILFKYLLKCSHLRKTLFLTNLSKIEAPLPSTSQSYFVFLHTTYHYLIPKIYFCFCDGLLSLLLDYNLFEFRIKSVSFIILPPEPRTVCDTKQFFGN